jgi:hypothetical protein
MTRVVAGSITPAMTGRRPFAHLHRTVEDRPARLLVVEHHLAGRAEHEQAVAAPGDQMLEHAIVGRPVDALVGVKRRDDRRDDAMETGHAQLAAGGADCAGEIIADAGGEMPRRDLAQRRPDGGAGRRRDGAAGAEHAARRRIGEARNVAGENLSRAPDVGIGRGNGRQQRRRIGMTGPRIQRRARRDLHDAPEIEHDDAVGDVFDDGEIVADEQHGQAEPLLQRAHEVDHLRLDRDVERRHRLVGDDQIGLQGQRPRDADALALAAGKFVRVAVDGVGRQVDAGESGARRLDPAGAVALLLDRQTLGQDLADGHARRQRGVGVLEDVLHARPDRAQRGVVERCQLGAVETDRGAGVRLDQAQGAAADRRLARSGFADQTDHLAARDLEADVLEHAQRLAAGDKRLRQVRDREEGRATHASTLAATAASAISRQRRQRTMRSAPAVSCAGASMAQASTAWSQRGAKAQPCGRRASEGTVPRIAGNGAPAGLERARLAEARHRAQQADRVGMPGMAQHVGGRPALDDAPGIHDGDAVGDLGDHAEIVRDEQHAHAALGLDGAQEIENLRLDGDIERRGRLVGDQQHGLAGERHGDGGALAHAAGQFVRILIDSRRAASGMPTFSTRSSARARAAARDRPRWMRSGSEIWSPMVSTGLRLVIGS